MKFIANIKNLLYEVRQKVSGKPAGEHSLLQVTITELTARADSFYSYPGNAQENCVTIAEAKFCR